MTFTTAHIIAFVATTLPRNADVADQLDLLADLCEIGGEDSFRVTAYRRAAQRVRDTPTQVAQLALDGRAKDLQGIGKTIEGKIVEIIEDGEIHALTKRKAAIPGDVPLFTRLPGLGPKSARKIWQELGITTLDELKEAAESQRLRTLAGMGAKTRGERPQGARHACAGGRAAAHAAREGVAGAARGRLRARGASRLRAGLDRWERAALQGELRDLDIIATANDADALIDYFTKLTG